MASLQLKHNPNLLLSSLQVKHFSSGHSSFGIVSSIVVGIFIGIVVGIVVIVVVVIVVGIVVITENLFFFEFLIFFFYNLNIL